MSRGARAGRAAAPAAGALRPVDETEFAGLMARLGPFEPAPRLAVAVSGGADSMALAVLLHDWARARAGRAIALTVDHGLRPEAAREAAQVARTLRPLGLEHHVLRWRGAKPSANVQAAARRARYALLGAWCARRGILHLALAHHLDDQAETLLLRLGRGSGLDGLAAMAPVAELAEVRLVRPLLGLAKARLAATLTARGLPWIEDPTNQDPSHARVRMRRLLPRLAADGLSAQRLAAAAGHLGRARAALEQAVAGLLARAAALHPAGFVVLDPGPLAAAPQEVGLRALSRVLMAVGGRDYAPRLERLERLYGRIVKDLAHGATLGGCRVVPRRGRLLVVREPGAVPACALGAGQTVHWDGRFEVRLGGPAPGPLSLSALGAAGWAEACRRAPGLRASAIPAPARPSLPALRDRAGLLAVPHLDYRRGDAASLTITTCRFAPRNGLTAAPFTVA